MKQFEKDIKTIIDIFTENLTTEALEKNEKNVEKLKAMAKDKNFFDKLELAQNQFLRIIENIIDIPKQQNMYIVEHIISGLYEHFYRILMEQSEGSAFCADKSSFIKNMTLKALKENTNISLYEDYTKYDKIKENKEEQAYWSPKTIADTDTAIRLFWNWYLLK